MKRIVEPEVMSSVDQALAYAAADFAAAHSVYPRLFAERFPVRAKAGRVLDLGCGPCDVTIRFARLLPGFRFDAVDGAAAMLTLAKSVICRHRLSHRIRLIEGRIPSVNLRRKHYDLILASSFLHHLHDPLVLWQMVRAHSRCGTMVFIPDLRRPATAAQARALTRRYSQGEPAVLQRDFFNSLRAAFTPAEVRRQLLEAGLPELAVEIISDRHLLVSGWVGRSSY